MPIAIPDGPELSVPKFAVDALHQPLCMLHEWCKQQVDTAVKSTIAEMTSIIADLNSQLAVLTDANASMLKGKLRAVKMRNWRAQPLVKQTCCSLEDLNCEWESDRHCLWCIPLGYQPFKAKQSVGIASSLLTIVTTLRSPLEIIHHVRPARAEVRMQYITVLGNGSWETATGKLLLGNWLRPWVAR